MLPKSLDRTITNGSIGSRQRAARRARHRTRRCARSHGVTKDGIQTSALVEAKRRAKETTKKYAKSFYMASLLMTSGRDVAYALYAWCRELDELVDTTTPTTTAVDAERALDGVLHRLQQVFRGEIPPDATYVDLALLDAVPRCVGLGVEPFVDMIAGMRTDIRRQRFETFADVDLYAYRVAGTVALMILPILTVGVNDDAKRLRLKEERGVALGKALQMTNIIRDVGEDRCRVPPRVYIAAEDLRLFNLTPEDVISMKNPTFAYKAAVEFQIQRALAYYRYANDGLQLLPSFSRPATSCIAGLYKKILLAVRENDYDNLNKRAFASTTTKVLVLPQIILRAFSKQVAVEANDCDLFLNFSDMADIPRQVLMCKLLAGIKSDDEDSIISIIEELKRDTGCGNAKQALEFEDDDWLPWYTLRGSSNIIFDGYVDELIKVSQADAANGEWVIYRRKAGKTGT